MLKYAFKSSLFFTIGLICFDIFKTFVLFILNFIDFGLHFMSGPSQINESWIDVASSMFDERYAIVALVGFISGIVLFFVTKKYCNKNGNEIY